jgi:quinol monooxygenase YgiN
MDTPWKMLTSAEPGREYLFLLSYLPLRTYGKIPALLRYMFQIQGQLRKTSGVIGYSLRAKILQRNFWTLSVWENEGALIDFVTKVPHREAMKKISPYMAATKFTRWKARGSAIPPDWKDAIRRESKES